MSNNISFMDILSKFCCCKSDGLNSDRERLLDGGGAYLPQESYHIPNGTTGTPYASSSSRMATSDRNLPPQVRSREEEEEDLMNKILDRTQQSIIDVTNLENNSLDIDMIQRSRLYAEAIKRHDSQTERRKGLLISGAGTTSDLVSIGSSQPAQINLLANLGPDAPEHLLSQQQSAVSIEELDLLNRFSELFLDAHRLGAQLECKEELIVYMSLDD